MTIISGARCNFDYSQHKSFSTDFPQGLGEEHLCAADRVNARDACRVRLPLTHKLFVTILCSWPLTLLLITHLCCSSPLQGDSGAALVTQDRDGRYVAAGFVDGGIGCGNRNFPGYYMNLRYKPHLSWIRRMAFSTPCQGFCIDLWWWCISVLWYFQHVWKRSWITFLFSYKNDIWSQVTLSVKNVLLFQSF